MLGQVSGTVRGFGGCLWLSCHGQHTVTSQLARTSEGLPALHGRASICTHISEGLVRGIWFQ